MRQKRQILITKEVSEYYDIAHFTDDKVEFDVIVGLVCDATGWTEETTYTRYRKTESVFRRGIIDLIANCNDVKLMECAKATGRDHTTVINSLKSIEDRLDTDMYTRTTLREIMDYIRENYKIGAQS